MFFVNLYFHIMAFYPILQKTSGNAPEEGTMNKS